MECGEKVVALAPPPKRSNKKVMKIKKVNKDG